MYKKIEIYTTDFPNKYLLKVDDSTMYVGFIIKEIIELLQENKSKVQLIQIINDKYKLDLKIDDLNNILDEKISRLLVSKKKNALIKLFKVLDPSKYQYPNFIQLIFNENIFYSILLLASILNIIIIDNITSRIWTFYIRK